MTKIFLRSKQIILAISILAVWLPSSFAETIKGNNQASMVHVPFIGCRNYAGNGGEPGGDFPEVETKDKVVQIAPLAAKKLAYYSSTIIGTLGPRGWYCIGYSGTSGGTLYVTPQPLKKQSDFDGTGSAVIVQSIDASTSGRFGVAGVIARFFPDYKRFVENVIKEGIEPASAFPFGPYAQDKLNYLSNSVVEIETPPHSEGFGTESAFNKNSYPINGVAILAKPAEETAGFLNEKAGWEGTAALLLRMRLQHDENGLTSQIIQQFEATK